MIRLSKIQPNLKLKNKFDDSEFMNRMNVVINYSFTLKEKNAFFFA